MSMITNLSMLIPNICVLFFSDSSSGPYGRFKSTSLGSMEPFNAVYRPYYSSDWFVSMTTFTQLWKGIQNMHCSMLAADIYFPPFMGDTNSIQLINMHVVD